MTDDLQLGASPLMHDRLLNAARELTPLVDEQAITLEREQTLTAALVDAFRETGLFWMMTPSEVGGGGADLLTSIAVLETVACADGSAGWSLMANNLATASAAAYCPDAAVDRMFGGGELPVMAGMLGPGGKAVEVDGGYRGSGNYAFGSGIGHADWAGGGMFVLEDGKPRLQPDGVPEVRVCFFPRDAIELRGNWNVMGLEGTGSFDYHVPEQFIPAEHTFDRSVMQPERGGAMFRLGLPGIGCAGHSAVILGMMQRALREVALIAREKKRPLYGATLDKVDTFLIEFARAEARYRSARALVMEVFGTAQAQVDAGTAPSVTLRQRIRQATTWAHEEARAVLDFCHVWAGSEAFREPSALSRCMRNVRVAATHIFVDPATMVEAGRVLVADTTD